MAGYWDYRKILQLESLAVLILLKGKLHKDHNKYVIISSSLLVRKIKMNFQFIELE